jgi:hypothetical protein
MNLRDIARDLLAGKLLLSGDELAAERLKVCAECEAFTKLSRQCKICHCFMDLKARILTTECPIDKW